VTGQAAWFDLRVRIEKCDPGEEVTEPQFPILPPPPGFSAPSSLNRFGAREGKS